MAEEQHNANVYELHHEMGYGHVYPEGHIIRVYKHILEWELQLTRGTIFDFGCSTGANLAYFSSLGFIPFGCDTSSVAIANCKNRIPQYADNFFVTPPHADLHALLKGQRLDIFLSNQVFCHLDDKGIRNIVETAYELVRPGGVFIASMMDYSCYFAKYINGESGDFKRVELNTPREKEVSFINFKHREEIEPLFRPFKKLHLGSYGMHIREEEGSSNHWLYIGQKEI
jgi:SAM-dependent methyltransferase